jgi:arylsulfatase
MPKVNAGQAPVPRLEGLKLKPAPLDASVAARIVALRPNITAGRNTFVPTHPMVGLPQGDSPGLLNTSCSVSAEITVPASGAEGMMLTSGGRFGGYGFYLKNGKPVWRWTMVDLERLKWGGVVSGTGTLKVDGKVVATKTMPKTLPMVVL